MQIHALKCFGTGPGLGNPALVVEDDDFDDHQRLAFARARQVAACAFVSRAGDAAPDYDIDFYYPHARSPLCLHATLAAAHVLFARAPQANTLHLRTRMAGQLLTLRRESDGLYIGLAPQSCPQPDIGPALVAALLGDASLALAAPPVIASVGSPKLLLALADVASLRALRPDLARITEWGRANKVNGCYVYSALGEGTYEGRNFNHLDALMEDSATGVAAGALTHVLQHALVLYQGAALGRPCRISSRFDGGTILVGGATELDA